MIVAQIAARLLRVQRSAGLRRAALALMLPFAGVMTAFGIAPDTVTDNVVRAPVVEEVALPVVAADAATRSAQTSQTSQTYWREEHIRRGDTLANVLARLRIQDTEGPSVYQQRCAGAPLVADGARPLRCAPSRTARVGW